MRSIFRFQPGTKLLAVLQAWPPGIDYFGLAYQTRKGRVVAKCVQREDNGQIKVFAFGEGAATLTAEAAVEIFHDLSDGLAQQSVEVSCCSTTRNQRLLIGGSVPCLRCSIREKKTSTFLRVFGELHRDLSYLMMGKGAWVAGADRRKTPGRRQSICGVASGSATSHPDLGSC